MTTTPNISIAALEAGAKALWGAQQWPGDTRTLWDDATPDERCRSRDQAAAVLAAAAPFMAPPVL